jgi:hypothetical protein
MGLCPRRIKKQSSLYYHALNHRYLFLQHNGYGIAVDSSSKKRVFYRCAKGGKYDNRHKDPTVHESKQRRDTSTMKTDCKYQAVAQEEDGQRRLQVLNNHNHGPVAALSVLPQYRTVAMTLEELSKVKQMNLENYSPSQILSSLRNANPQSNLIPRDIYNLLAGFRLDELAGKTLTELLFEVCFYSFEQDLNNLLRNCIETLRKGL